MKNLHKTLILIPLFIICGFLIYATSYKNITKKNHVEYPTDMDFCGEKVPTNQSDVKERLDREMLVNINSKIFENENVEGSNLKNLFEASMRFK